jgi:hypothetical protein
MSSLCVVFVFLSIFTNDREIEFPAHKERVYFYNFSPFFPFRIAYNNVIDNTILILSHQSSPRFPKEEISNSICSSELYDRL